MLFSLWLFIAKFMLYQNYNTILLFQWMLMYPAQICLMVQCVTLMFKNTPTYAT